SRVQELISDLDNQRRGNVTLYCMEGAVEGWVSQIVGQYRQRHPGIRFQLHVSSTDQSLEALIKGECDIAIIFKAPRKPEVISVARGHEPLVALVAPEHPVAHHTTIQLRELFQYNIVMPDNRFGVRQVVDRKARALGITPALAVTTNSIAMTRSQ